MLPADMKVNKKWLPIKGHYFLFNAGTAPLVPYLSTYARQLGFSPTTVGLIYTVLPILGLIAKPLFGVIADRFKIQKPIFIIFQILTIVAFAAIYFVPESSSHATVGISCDDGVSVLQSCYMEEKMIDDSKIETLYNESGTAACRMNCDMTSPRMWQTVCEHWHLPQYCYSATDSINYTAYIAGSTVKDNCAYLAANNVSLEGKYYTPHCQLGTDYVDINEPCSLRCDDAVLSGVIGGRTANMTCGDHMLNYRLCVNDIGLLPNNVTSKCEAYCDLDSTTPWRLMEICDGWEAASSASCQPKTRRGQPLPSNLSFTGYVDLNTAQTVSSCLYVTLKNVSIPNGDSQSIHYPYCAAHELFTTSCQISCNNDLLNEVFEAATASRDGSSQYNRQFWLFFMLMSLSWVGMAVVVTFADAICFNLLGVQVSQYGKQRLWGSVGWGVFSLLTGALIDAASPGAGHDKNYAVAFVLMFVFMCGDVVVSCFLKFESTKMSVSILADVGTLLLSLPTVIFFLWTIAVGLCTGLLWQFLFWHLEDIARESGNSSEYDKTLQGLVSAIQTFGGEIPFMFVSGYILKRLGHVNMMSLVLFAFGVRFILYSVLSDAWWVLPVELLQGITFGMFYPTMASYAKVVAPPGTDTTVQGLVGAIFEGVGTSLGSLIGGRLYETYGGWNTFLWFGVGSLVVCVLHIGVQWLIKDKTPGLTQGGYMSIIRYEQPGDMVCIMEERPEGREMQLR